MDTKALNLKIVCCSLAILYLCEKARTAAAAVLPWPDLAVLGMVRIIEISALLVIVFSFTRGLSAVGLGSRQILPGLGRGLIWSAGFGLVTAVGFGLLFLFQINPLNLLRFSLPGRPGLRLLFFLVGGFIAPVAEELLFRGILYGYLRRFGILAAIGLSTLVFALAHPGLPLIQTCGGLVFAVAYEMEKKLMTPIVIHCLGNLALFSLSAF